MPGEFNVVMASLKLQQHIHFLYICLVEKLNFCILFSAKILEATYRVFYFTGPVPKGVDDDKNLTA